LELDQIRTQIAAQRASMARASAAVGAAKSSGGSVSSDLSPAALFEAVRSGEISRDDALKTAATQEQIAAIGKGFEQFNETFINSQFEGVSFKDRTEAYDTLTYKNPYVPPETIQKVILSNMPVKSSSGQSFGSRVGKAIKENPGKAALYGATGVAGYLGDKAVSGISKFVRDIKDA
jgi:hypothetical protein